VENWLTPIFTIGVHVTIYATMANLAYANCSMDMHVDIPHRRDNLAYAICTIGAHGHIPKLVIWHTPMPA
jgi:hypothetical protein